MDHHERIAVHYNFQARCLSVRAIHPVTGSLTKKITDLEEAWLKNCELTYDEGKWKKWRDGNKHARQFAEIRGILIHPDPAFFSMEDSDPILYEPRTRPDFHLRSGLSVPYAAHIHIHGTKITAFGI